MLTCRKTMSAEPEVEVDIGAEVEFEVEVEVEAPDIEIEIDIGGQVGGDDCGDIEVEYVVEAPEVGLEAPEFECVVEVETGDFEYEVELTGGVMIQEPLVEVEVCGGQDFEVEYVIDSDGDSKAQNKWCCVLWTYIFLMLAFCGVQSWAGMRWWKWHDNNVKSGLDGFFDPRGMFIISSICGIGSIVFFCAAVLTCCCKSRMVSMSVE